jgi:hypothetical protein
MSTAAGAAAIDAALPVNRLMAQETDKKLSNGDLEDRLNAQLGGLLEAAKAHPELQGFTIPRIKIDVVKEKRQPDMDIDVKSDGKAGEAKFVIARDTLDGMSENQQCALVADALSKHILKLGGARLSNVGLTDYARNMQGRGAQNNPGIDSTFANFILPLRADELAITLMKADKTSPSTNPAHDYSQMLVVRKSQEGVRLEEFTQARQNAKIPDEFKKPKDEINAAKKARAALAQLNRINGQSFEFDGNGQFNANVPADYDRRLQNVQVTHPEALVATAPAKPKVRNVDWREVPIDKWLRMR